jgi:hypothetical protein
MTPWTPPSAWTALQRELLAVEDVLTHPALLRRQVAGRTLLYVGGNRRVHPVYYPQDRTAAEAARAMAVLSACHGASCHAVRTASVASFLAALMEVGASAGDGPRPGLRCPRHA